MCVVVCRAQKRLRADGEDEDEEEEAKAQGDEAALGNGHGGEGPMDGEGEEMMEDGGQDMDGLSGTQLSCMRGDVAITSSEGERRVDVCVV